MTDNKEKEGYIERKYREFYEKHGYIPEIFCPYNGKEVTDYAPTLGTCCGSASGIGSLLILEKVEKEDEE